MDGRQEFAFQVDRDIQKLVSVSRVGRSIDVTVRFAAEVMLNSTTTRIENAIDPQLRADDHGLTIEWKAPLIPGFNWLTSAQQRRF